jgi:hypothetical protein
MRAKTLEEQLTVRGLIIRESLRTRRLPLIIRDRVDKCYSHLLGGERPVEVIVVRVPEMALASASFALADELLPQGFYAHFVTSDRIIVVFPHCISIVIRGDSESTERAKQIGRSFGISDSQMKFQAMFEEDHPKCNHE